MSQIYREIILDHYANPRNKGDIKGAQISSHDWNPLCGDMIKIDLNLDSKGKVSQVKFNGQGCAISQASASMLTEEIHGKLKSEIAKIKENDILEMIQMPISPGRMKCALLGWLVLRKALGLETLKSQTY